MDEGRVFHTGRDVPGRDMLLRDETTMEEGQNIVSQRSRDLLRIGREAYIRVGSNSEIQNINSVESIQQTLTWASM